MKTYAQCLDAVVGETYWTEIYVSPLGPVFHICQVIQVKGDKVEIVLIGGDDTVHLTYVRNLYRIAKYNDESTKIVSQMLG